MTEDRSLSDFVNATGANDSSGGSGGSDRSDEDSGGDLKGASPHAEPETDDHATSTNPGPGTPDADSGLSTYAWGTYTCRSCGETVDHVWRVEDDLVCSRCVQW
ncbi:hypothetical protein ACLI4Q_01355 [Natrialbaceae archaeon A-CW1-1]